MARRRFHLLLSGLDGSPPGKGRWPALPAMQQLLSKGDPLPFERDPFAAMFGAFSLATDGAQDRPVAPLRALGDGLDAGSGWWLCVDPVHLVADRDQLYLSAAESLAVSRDEADELVQGLNHLFSEAGWRFHAPEPGRWYLQLPAPLAMQTVPTHEAMGCRVGDVLPRGEDALQWQRSMTEIQMWLHASAVNARRTAAGALPLNSLWCWGGGSLPAASAEVAWGRVVAEEPLLRGLGRLHQLAVEPLPLEQAVAQARPVLWQERVTSLEAAEERRFVPLLAMLREGLAEELRIEIAGIGCWKVTRAALRRWWRRRRPLGRVLGSGG